PVSRWCKPKWAARCFASVPLPDAAGPSIAMITLTLPWRGRVACRRRAGRGERGSRKLAAQGSHQLNESREARGNKGRVVHLHWLLARESEHQRRHGDTMIHVGGDEAAATRAAITVHDEIVAFDLDGDTVAREQRGGRGKPIGFLDAQLFEAAHPRRA